MFRLVVAVALSVALVSIPSAFASSITNRDGSDHQVRVIEGNAATDHILQPSRTLEGVCNSGCVVRLNDNPKDEYKLQGLDVVSIEDGYLYYDGPPASAVPKAGDADRPSETAPE